MHPNTVRLAAALLGGLLGCGGRVAADSPAPAVTEHDAATAGSAADEVSGESGADAGCLIGRATQRAVPFAGWNHVYGSASVVLRDGRVLVTGGFTDDGSPHDARNTWLYEPSADKWSRGASMHVARALHTAAVLPDGRVLVAGGRELRYDELYDPVGDRSPLTTSAEIWDPATNYWARTTPLGEPRVGARAVALESGDVLVIGGERTDWFVRDLAASTGEVYKPSAESWSVIAAPTRAHEGFPAPLAARLRDGRVIVSRAQSRRDDPTATADLGPPAKHVDVAWRPCV